MSLKQQEIKNFQKPSFSSTFTLLLGSCGCSWAMGGDEKQISHDLREAGTCHEVLLWEKYNRKGKRYYYGKNIIEKV